MHVPTTANHITGIVESNYHKILIFSPPKSLKSLRAARIDQLADSNEPAITWMKELLTNSLHFVFEGLQN